MNTLTAIPVKSLIRDRENKEEILRLRRHEIYLSIDMKNENICWLVLVEDNDERYSRSLSPEPESCSEIVRTWQEGSLGGRVNHPPHTAIVAQGQQLLPAGVPSVPGAQWGRGLVREHDEVLRVVEHGLGLVLLLARGPRPGVGNQTPASGQFPQLH